MSILSQFIPSLADSATRLYQSVEAAVGEQATIAADSNPSSGPSSLGDQLLKSASNQLLAQWNGLKSKAQGSSTSNFAQVPPEKAETFSQNFKQIVEASVNEVVYLFNLPPNERLGHHFWMYGPKEEIVALHTLLQQHRSLFEPDTYALMQLDLDRALALLAPGSHLGSDKVIAALKKLGKDLTKEQQRDPRFREILDHAQLHLRKIYLRRNLKEELQASELGESGQENFSLMALLEKAKTAVEAGIAYCKDNPDEFEALKIRAFYRETMAQVNHRAVDYVVERYRRRGEPVLIEGWIDFCELSSQLKSWETHTHTAVVRALEWLEAQQDNPELSYTEIKEMRANLQLAKALFSENPLESLREMQQKLSGESMAAVAVRTSQAWAWDIFDRIHLERKIEGNPTLVDLVLERKEADSIENRQISQLTPQTSGPDAWQGAALDWLDQCLSDENCRNQALTVVYQKAVQSAEAWLAEPSTQLPEAELAKIKEAERLLADDQINVEFSADDKTLLCWNLKRLELLLHAYSFEQKTKQTQLIQAGLEEVPSQIVDPLSQYEKMLQEQASQAQASAEEKVSLLEDLQNEVEAQILETPEYHAFRAQIATDLLIARAKVATTAKSELNFFGATIMLKDEEYDAEKIEASIERAMTLVRRLPPEAAAQLLKGIVEYFVFKVRSVNLLKGQGVQALITLLRDYPQTQAAAEIHRNPELQAMIQQMTVNGRIPQELRPDDLTIDDMTQAMRVYMDKGFNTHLYRKYTYVIGTLAVLAAIDVWRVRKDPKALRKLLSLGAATDLVVNNLSASIIVGSLGFDTAFPALNHRYEAERAATFQLGQVSDEVHDQNIDLFINTLGYMPAFYGASYLVHGRPLLGLVGGNALSARGMALTAGLAIPLHHHFVDTFSPLGHEYSVSGALGMGAAALLPVGIRHTLSPQKFPLLYLNAQRENVHVTLSFLHAAIGIYGAAHLVGESYPFPSSTVGFYAMEFMDQTIYKVNFMRSRDFQLAAGRTTRLGYFQPRL